MDHQISMAYISNLMQTHMKLGMISEDPSRVHPSLSSKSKWGPNSEWGPEPKSGSLDPSGVQNSSMAPNPSGAPSPTQTQVSS